MTTLSHTQDAAENDRLGSATYRKLMLGCMVKSAFYLAAFAQASQSMGTVPLNNPGVMDSQSSGSIREQWIPR